MRYFPTSLPTPVGPGYELTPVDPFLRADMEVGPARNRRLTHARMDRVQAVWVFTPAEFTAFRAWFEDLGWSLAGHSDDLSDWFFWNATWVPTGLGSALQPIGWVVETAATGGHWAQKALPGVIDGADLAVTAVLRPAGRTLARVAVIGRDGTERWCEINAATGAITGSFGLTGAPTLLPLADGAVRLAMVAPVGTGGADPVLRVQLLQGAGVTSYAGTPGLGLAVSEVNARLATGADLYLPTDAAGRARGVAGGAAWAWVPVWTGGVFKPQETRLERMYSLEILPGLHARVSAPLEVRLA